MNAIRDTVYTQLRDAKSEINQLKDRVAQLSAKCFKLNNERSKWEQRYRAAQTRLDRLTVGDDPRLQMGLYTDPQGNRASESLIEEYRAAMNPQAAFTVAQVAAWAAAGKPRSDQ